MLRASMLCFEKIHFSGRENAMYKQACCVLSKNVVLRAFTLCWDQVYLWVSALCLERERCVQSKFLCFEQECFVKSKYAAFKVSMLYWEQVRCLKRKYSILRTSMPCFERVSCVRSEYAMFKASMLYFEQVCCVEINYAVFKQVRCVQREIAVFWASTLRWKHVHCVQRMYIHAVFWANVLGACTLCSKQGKYDVCFEQVRCVLSMYVLVGECTLFPKQIWCFFSIR